MPRSLRRLAVALAVFAIAASACSQASSSAVAGPPSTSTSPGGVAKVLDFTAPLLGGGTLRGSDYTGKDVAIWFWAPW
ncbi:MAG TPA: hypothetical protein VGR41_10185 [Actinomycetota bacterium]|jgi:hypothetical protein|nr:hypothetical protein [Actinomycetota bacterium]